MSIRFLCEGNLVWELRQLHSMPVPDIDEYIHISGIKYRVNFRDWIADTNGVHVTIHLSHSLVIPKPIR